MVTVARDIASIGYAACQLQVGVARLRRAAVELGIEPAMTINGIEHFSDEQIELIREYLSKNK